MREVVVYAGRLLDGTGSEPHEEVALHVDQGVITGLDKNVSRNAQIIDCSDLTVMPGLIDCHVHFWSSPSSIEERMHKPYTLRVAEAFRNARATLDAGFTSVRDAGGTPVGVKKAIEAGLMPGPRTRIAVGYLSQTAGHGDFRYANGLTEFRAGPEHPPNVADGVDGVRKATREMLHAGADHIKVCTSGGVNSPSDESTSTGYTLEEIQAVVYEAHAAGKTVMSHAIALQGIRNAIAAGVESIEHGVYLDEETAESMKAQGTYLVPTVVAGVWILRRSERNPGSVPEYVVRKANEIVATHRETVRMAIEMGVPIALGTDSGVGEHGSNAEELEIMVQLGMSPMQAIVAATKTAAECCRIAHLTGTLEPGKRADLIGIAGDPLSDISVLQDQSRIPLVLRDGLAVRDCLSRLLDDQIDDSGRAVKGDKEDTKR